VAVSSNSDSALKGGVNPDGMARKLAAVARKDVPIMRKRCAQSVAPAPVSRFYAQWQGASAGAWLGCSIQSRASPEFRPCFDPALPCCP
jgi:hypothetical protein